MTSCAKPLRIAVLAHVRHPIRPPFSGGMEAHAWHLARGMADRGHRVTLFASGDSDAGVPLIATVDEHYERTLPWSLHHGGNRLQRYLADAYERVLDELCNGDFDVIHNNTLHPLPIRRAAEAGLAMLTSLHVPPFQALHDAVRDSRSPGLHYTVTSARQRSIWWPEVDGGQAQVVHNGIDPSAWPYHSHGDGSAVWAGRIDPNKGAHLAVRAARLAGIPLTLMGPIADRDYFDDLVSPLLDAQRRYAGHLNGADMAGLFGRASLLLFTPVWEEPFGLVAVEAMACGLPVAAFDHGAAREVIGEAGAFATHDDAPGLAAAIGQAMRIPRMTARARVERRFGLERMLGGYERLYPACISGARSASDISTRSPVAPFPAANA